MSMFGCAICRAEGKAVPERDQADMIQHLDDRHGVALKDFVDHTVLLRSNARGKNRGGATPTDRVSGQIMNEDWAPQAAQFPPLAEETPND